jgi:hypothetical protein
MALLKVNWDVRRHDYVESFVPMVAYCISRLKDDVVTLPEVQAALRSEFGLRLPHNQVQTLLGRVQKHKYITVDHGAYRANRAQLDKLTFTPIFREVTTKHENLLASLIRFVGDHGTSWSAAEAEAALHAYLQRYQLLVLDRKSYGEAASRVTDRIGPDYYIASFLSTLTPASPELEYLETVVKGNLLATAIFLPDPGRIAKKFKKTTAYIDTKILMFALGFAGPERQAPSAELVDLLIDAGAEVGCFSHTLDEMRSILNACAFRLASNRLRDAHGPSIEYFIERGFKASDVELFSVQLDETLHKRGISIRNPPPHIREDVRPYVIEEQELANNIGKRINYSNPEALWRDVGSISAISRLRGGRGAYQLEEAGAIFVTANKELVLATLESLAKELEAGQVPPIMTDTAMTTNLWLKVPTSAPDLPRKKLIAACYAALQPDERLWQAYLRELSRLTEAEELTSDNYYLLRHSLDARKALMDVTLGEPRAFTEGTVQEVLDLVRERIIRESDERAATAERNLHQAQSKADEEVLRLREETKSLQRQLEERDREMAGMAMQEQELRKQHARILAGRIVSVARYALMAALVVGALATFPRDGWSSVGDKAKLLLALTQAGLFLWSIFDLYAGTVTGLRRMEIRLQRAIGSLLGSTTKVASSAKP